MIHLSNNRIGLGLGLFFGALVLSRRDDIRPRIADLGFRMEGAKSSLRKKGTELLSIGTLSVGRAVTSLKINKLFHGHFPCLEKSSTSHDPKHHIACLFKDLKQDFISGKDISSHVETLKALTGKEENREVIEFILRQMNGFLNELREPSLVDSWIHFIVPLSKTHSKAYPEDKKNELLKLCDFFPLINDCLSKVIDKKLIAEIKINFSNLPFEGSRESLIDLFMDKEDQVTYLFEALQEEEDALVDNIVSLLGRNPCFLLEKDIEILSKMLESELDPHDFSVPSKLSEKNKTKLREGLEHQVKKGHSPLQQVLDAALSIKEEFLSDNPAKLLKRTSKCKTFFQDQLNSSKEDSKIPYWYHATRKDRMALLVKSAQIKVMFKGPTEGFKGAWISSLAEVHLFGSSVLALSNDVEELDTPYIGYTYPDRRWRGLLVPILLKEKSIVVAASVQSNDDKTAQKISKIDLNQMFIENHYPKGYKIFSRKQLVFLQKEINCILGNPNLSSAFWGR